MPGRLVHLSFSKWIIGKYWSWDNCSSRAHLTTETGSVPANWQNGGLQKAAACSCSRPGGYGELAATPVIFPSSLLLLLITYINKSFVCFSNPILLLELLLMTNLINIKWVYRFSGNNSAKFHFPRCSSITILLWFEGGKRRKEGGKILWNHDLTNLMIWLLS